MRCAGAAAFGVSAEPPPPPPPPLGLLDDTGVDAVCTRQPSTCLWIRLSKIGMLQIGHRTLPGGSGSLAGAAVVDGVEASSCTRELTGITRHVLRGECEAQPAACAPQSTGVWIPVHQCAGRLCLSEPTGVTCFNRLDALGPPLPPARLLLAARLRRDELGGSSAKSEVPGAHSSPSRWSCTRGTQTVRVFQTVA